MENKIKEFEQKFELLKEKLESDYIKDNIEIIEKQMSKEDFWQNSQKASLFIKELKKLKQKEELIQMITKNLEEINFLLIEFTDEEEEINKIFKQLKKNIRNLEILTLLVDKHDENEAFLEIHPGAGGIDSADFAKILLNMYEKFFEQQKIPYDIINIQHDEIAGIKSVILEIKQNYSYGFLKNEQGIHRLIRISPFDTGKRRHTSFASVKIIPKLELENILLDPKELKIDTYRSSGAGGQSVNTTDSAVRITHIPTKISVTCQNERSQIQNKEQALRILKNKINLKKEEEDKKIQTKLIGTLNENAFGSQKRTYTMHPYKLVRDHQTKEETAAIEKVLNGNIENFIYAGLLNNKN